MGQRGVKRPLDAPHAAFLVDTAPQFTELSRVARVLSGSGWNVTFIFDGGYRALERDLETCRATGYGFVLPPRRRQALASLRSWLSWVKQGLRAHVGWLRRSDDRRGTDLTLGSVEDPLGRQRHFTVPLPRLLLRYARLRFRRWRKNPVLTVLPGEILGTIGTFVELYPTLVKYIARVWLPYRLRRIRRSFSKTVRRSRFDPVWLFTFVAGTLIPYWMASRRLRRRQSRLLRTAARPIEAPTALPGITQFLNSALEHSAADFEILRIQGRFLDHHEVLIDRNINLLVLAKDCAYYQTGFWVKAARQIGVGTILVPFDDADTQALAEHRSGHKDHLIGSDYARAVADKYPEWVIKWAGEDLILLQPELVEARARLGLTPANPWAYNSTLCDKVLVESAAKRQKMLAEGAPAEQVIVNMLKRAGVSY
jgi:hypothetical protein